MPPVSHKFLGRSHLDDAPTALGFHVARKARRMLLVDAYVVVVGAILTLISMIVLLAVDSQDGSDDVAVWATPAATSPSFPPLEALVPIVPASVTPAPSTAIGRPRSASPPSNLEGKPSLPAATRSKEGPSRAGLHSLLTPGNRISLESVSQPQWRMRHRNSQLRLDRVTERSPRLDRADATFIVRRGLGKSACLSLESINFPGYFIRHRNFALWLDVRDNTTLFALDATFCPRSMDPDGRVVFYSANFPDRLIMADGDILAARRVPVSSAEVFRVRDGFQLDIEAPNTMP